MMVDLDHAQQTLLHKVLESYLSELRQAIAATKRDTTEMHAEETLIKELQRKLGKES